MALFIYLFFWQVSIYLLEETEQTEKLSLGYLLEHFFLNFRTGKVHESSCPWQQVLFIPYLCQWTNCQDEGKGKKVHKITWGCDQHHCNELCKTQCYQCWVHIEWSESTLLHKPSLILLTTLQNYWGLSRLFTKTLDFQIFNYLFK